MSSKHDNVAAPARPAIGFSIGVTGHRSANAAFSANKNAIEIELGKVFDAIDWAIGIAQKNNTSQTYMPTCLHSLLVDGLDQIAAHQAIDRNWHLVAPLPFGRALNTAINAHPSNLDEATALLTSAGTCSPETTARAAQISNLLVHARCFELADQDVKIGQLYLDKLAAPQDMAKAQTFSFEASQRVELAAQVMIEQSDLIIGVWDGASTSFTGGTGHTIALALSMGAPVLWIDARAPTNWQIFFTPEELAGCDQKTVQKQNLDALIIAIVNGAIETKQHNKHGPKSNYLEEVSALDGETWRSKSSPFWHGYRRVEALFGGKTLKERFKSLRQTYESPDAIGMGSGKSQLDEVGKLLAPDKLFLEKIQTDILRRFAWADGISSKLSDTYRGGMILNFVFSGFAIVGGMAYLPFATSEQKWIFAIIELTLLCAILMITFVGQKRRWHGRWFETRRVAEYLRHAPILLLLGVSRPPGRWPKGSETSWPEHYARHSIACLGLPQIAITADYIRAAFDTVLLPYVSSQIGYHKSKAARLARVHHNLDELSSLMFTLAVASVCCYLALKIGVKVHLINDAVTSNLSKLFTFLGVLFPTFGGAIAGIRYFGDFERFSAISDVTAAKLEGIEVRLRQLLTAPISTLTYAHAAQLAHETDDIVISEIESWQAVFSGKHITVPV